MRILRFVVPVAVIVVLTAGVWFLKTGRDPSPSAGQAEVRPKKIADAGRNGRARAAKPSGRGKTLRNGASAVPEASERTPAEREAIGRISSARESEDLEALRALVGEALKSPSAEVRQEMVGALGWFGKDALVELTKFLCDADKGVAESALAEWNGAVDSVEDESYRIAAAESALLVLERPESCSDVARLLQQADDQRRALETAVRVLRAGNPGAVAAVRETFEFLTGERFAGLEAAERYLRDHPAK